MKLLHNNQSLEPVAAPRLIFSLGQAEFLGIEKHD